MPMDEIQELRAEIRRLQNDSETATLQAGIIEGIMEAIVAIDEAQNIVQFNVAAEKMFGYRAEEMLGKNLGTLMPNALLEGNARYFAENDALAQLPKLMRTLSGRRSNGKVFPLELSISRIVSNGKVFHVAILRDVSEQERLDKLILRQYDSLNALHLITLGLLNRRNVTDLLQFIAEEAKKLLDVAYCEILLPQDDFLVARAYTQNQPFQAGNRFNRKEAVVSWQVLDTGQPVVLEDYSTWAHRHEIYAGEEFHATAVLPLTVHGQCIGVLGITRDVPGHPFTEEEILIAARFADIASLAIENSRLYQDVKRLAITDELTNIHNRRSLLEMGEREVRRASRYGRPLTVLMVDVDRFKLINDTWGHAAGDIVLRGVAQEIQRRIRTPDMLGRYVGPGQDTENILGRFGGEEFGLLFPETSSDGAQVVAERIRAAIQRMSFIVPSGVDKTGQAQNARVQVTVSIGIAALESPSQGLLDLFALADHALYQAKKAGRNRVCAAETCDPNASNAAQKPCCEEHQT